MSVSTRWSIAAPYLRSALRIVAAFMFVLAGTGKLFAFPVGIPPHGSTAKMFQEAWFAGIIETCGGGLLLLGLFSRCAAFVLSGEMAVAYFQVHAARGFWPTMNGGVSAALYCFIWLYISAAGPGPLSVDALRHRA
jgi:putative oxidoreductase